MRIAIVEAEPAAADILMFVAQRRGHQPVCVATVDRLLDRLPFEPAVAVISLPDISDETLGSVSRLRERFPAITTLVIVERSTTLSPLAALRAGVQDVIQSPYHPHEVMVRAEGWLEARAAAKAVPDSAARIADLEVDLDRFVATKNGNSLPLTRLERRLLYCLCTHYPNITPLERLLNFGWESSGEPEPALLKTHISHIRKKLRDAGGTPFEISSQQTVGYTLSVAEGEARAS